MYGLGEYPKPKHETRQALSYTCILKSSMNTVLFVNAIIGFSEILF